MHSITLKNSDLTVSILTKGAELASIKSDTLEYIWQADPTVWARHAPILFPIVGRLKDNEYIYKNQTYHMKQHGFARDNEFKVVDKTIHSVTFEQVATETTKKIYPFEFVLQVKYTLENKKLEVAYRVINPANETLYFSIGAHPGFRCPFEEGQKRSDYALVFDKKVAPVAHTNNNGLYKGESHSVFVEPGVLDLPDSIFEKDSLTFSPNPFSKVTVVHKPSQKAYLSLSFKDVPYLGIWSANATSSFICIEPWHGIADRADHNKLFVQKEGIMQLAPDELFECHFTIEIY